jgi:hypothetical protein
MKSEGKHYSELILCSKFHSKYLSIMKFFSITTFLTFFFFFFNLYTFQSHRVKTRTLEITCSAKIDCTLIIQKAPHYPKQGSELTGGTPAGKDQSLGLVFECDFVFQRFSFTSLSCPTGSVSEHKGG